MYVCLAICNVKHSWSQTKNIRHEIVIQNDNDVYLLTSQDRYYTNGININYRLGLKSDTSRIKNRILDVEFGQKMYNGINLSAGRSLQWDRPFAGYLYLSGELNQYYNDEQILSLKVELGQVGPLAKGREVQKVIHQVFNMYEVSGWNQEVSNAFGVDLGVKYQKLIYRSINHSFEISGMSSGTLGMNHINAHVGLPIRWGRLRSFSHSVFTKGHVQSRSNDRELFLYYVPAVNFVGYNATIQGGLAHHDINKEQYQIEKIIYSHKIGFMLANGRSSLGLSYIFQSREAKEMLYKTHQYGTIFYGLRF
ncbi:lipid A deacylase LpxR family protein [Sphingobacterium sp. KU25419]|nr:lipid A deacylase LpxR family protein [Sphingobacterium sp. KU25419]